MNRNSRNGIAALILTTMAAAAEAGVTFAFAAADTYAVPLNPWLMAATGILLALGALAMARKHAGPGQALLLAGLVVAAGVVVDARDVNAGLMLQPMTPVDLVSSPTHVDETILFTCVLDVVYVRNATGQAIVLNNLTYDVGFSPLQPGDPDYDNHVTDLNFVTQNAEDCHVGMRLAPAATCRLALSHICG